jgi:phosphomannomutase
LSNTEPLLRLNLEADNKELMNEKIEEVKGIIEQ